MNTLKTSMLRYSAFTPSRRGFVASRAMSAGVAAALKVVKEGSNEPVKPPLFAGFSLAGRVGIVSGGNRGIGLELALTLAEAGAKVYVLDLPDAPGDTFKSVQKYVERFQTGAQLNYISGGVDVSNQKSVWDAISDIGEKEGRVDVGIAAAGVIMVHDSMTYPADKFTKVMDVDTNGVFYTAQAIAQQMERFKTHGSIILVSSVAGSVGNRDAGWVAYHTAKGATKQLARSLACEWGVQNIRVNSLSPGYIQTEMTGAFLDTQPGLLEKWASSNPLGRIGRPDELRGVVAWLASDMSTFCTGSDIIISGGHHSW